LGYLKKSSIGMRKQTMPHTPNPAHITYT
jgi:hypothetical protein